MKTCSKCKVVKELDEFHIASKSRDGHFGSCKICARESSKARYVANRDKRLIQTKKWREENKERCRTRSAEYRKTHKRKRTQKDNERSKQYNKRPYVRKRLNVYYRKRRRTDPQFAIKTRLRTRLGLILKQKGLKKSERCMKLLGCDLVEFKAYFSSLFTEGMTWERFLEGEIHIDHIRPCASFDLTDPEQQKICFHWTNLQPLWAIDNLIKSDKMSETAVPIPAASDDKK